ncbi:MAG: glycosyltransferase [Cyanobacteriota bacterium]|nr:glycosyltransferase [Cyanobacteriota bacterium]
MNHSEVPTLFITRQLPYPPIGGVPLRNWQNINIMMKLGSVAVFSIPSDGLKPQVETLPGVKIWQNYQVGELRKARSLFRKIRDRLWWLQPRSHPWANQLYGETVAEDLERVLREFKPKIVIFEELWLYRYLSVVQRHGCHTIYDAHNVEILLRKDIELANQKAKLQSKIESKLLLNKVESIERALIEETDQIWTCSAEDTRLLGQLSQRKLPTHVIANGINVTDYNSVRQGECPLPDGLERNPQTLIFTALFSHPPNAVAAQILIEEIYPELCKTYPQCRLILAGRNPTALMKQANKKEVGILVTGEVPDMRPYLAAASLVIVPLLDGGGTRLKILEAFAAGRPVVSTAKGAEGLKGKDGEHLLIRNSVEEMVAGVSNLWSDAALTQKLVDSAWKLVCAEYSWEAVGKRVEKAIAELP